MGKTGMGREMGRDLGKGVEGKGRKMMEGGEEGKGERREKGKMSI